MNNEEQIELWRKQLKHYHIEVELEKVYEERLKEINDCQRRISQLEKLLKAEKRKLKELKL